MLRLKGHEYSRPMYDPAYLVASLGCDLGHSLYCIAFGFEDRP